MLGRLDEGKHPQADTAAAGGAQEPTEPRIPATVARAEERKPAERQPLARASAEQPHEETAETARLEEERPADAPPTLEEVKHAQHPRTDREWKWSWKWVVPVVLAACLLITGLVFYVIGNSSVERLALAQAQSDADVVQRLGEPIRRGWFTEGGIETSDSRGQADLFIPLSGPKGKGTLHAVATRSAGQWKFVTLRVKVGDSGEEIDLLQGLPELLAPEAMMARGNDYLFGRGVPRDYQQAVTWYLKAVEAGSRAAMTNLGFMYHNGYGVDKDDAQAVGWYRKAATAGDVMGMRGLGFLYQNGYGVEKDYAQAMNWYRKAAEAGNADAMTNLGGMYANGQGVNKDYVQAVIWYRKAAEAGNVQGMTSLGFLYEHGYGVEKDDKQAISWYRKAADKGDSEGQNAVAWVCATSSDPAVRNPSTALDYALKAVDATKETPNPDFLDTLAEAYYVNQRFQDAVSTEERAIALVPQEKKAQFQTGLEKYRHALQVGK